MPFKKNGGSDKEQKRIMYKSLCLSYMSFIPYGSEQSAPPCCVPSPAHLMSTPRFLGPLQLSSFSVLPINPRVSNQLSVGVLACEGGERVLTMPASCPLSSPVCQAFSDATVLANPD